MTAWITLAVLALMFALLVREVLPADVTLFGALVTLWALGVIDTTQAVSGFNNPQVLTVGLLFVVAAAVRDSGALRLVTTRLFRGVQGHRQMLGRITVPTAAASAFLNNTPIVAMLAPAVRDWAFDHDKLPSQLLIPLSYASILGGTCTLIGTSTNLVVSALIVERGLAPFSMFELAAVGVPATICGIALLIVAGPALLPRRTPPDAPSATRPRDPDGQATADAEDARSYSVRFRVAPDSPLAGQTVTAAGLRHLEGLFLVEIIRRNRRRVAPARSTDRIEANDQLVFVGVADTVAELLAMPGLTPVADAPNKPPGDTNRVHELVISETSWLLGKNLRQANFRRRYDAAVIAIHRGGARLHRKLGDVRLRQGDTLLVLASQGFRATWANSSDFYIIARPTAPDEAPSTGRLALTLLILVTMVALMTAGVTSNLLAVAIAALAMILTGAIDADRARSSIDLSVLVLIASSFGISQAVQSSGLADRMAGLLTSVAGPDQTPLVALAAVYLMCAVTTEVLSNNAAAAILLPIALSVAHTLQLDPRPFAVAIAVAASMSFVTPLGYQTNLLVYGPGGYRFGDFVRVGVPMALVCFVVAMIVIPIAWPLR